MRVRHASVGIAAALSLAACSSKALPPPAYPLAPPSAPAQTAVQTISEAGGGSVALRDASVVIRPDLLRGNQQVRVTYDPLVRETPPNQGWAIVPGELTVAFTAGTHRPPRLPVRTYTPQTAPSGLLLRMRYPAAYAAAVERARAPLVTFTDDHGTHRIVLDGTFDAATHTVTVVVPRPMFDHTTSVRLALGTDAYSATAPLATGGRWWNDAAGTWSTQPLPLDPSRRTLVMVHGIFSTVESAFPCAHDYDVSAGGGPGAYAQIVGFDYDYTQPPSEAGPLLARFITQLGLRDYDIEAHSYGTLVTLAALSHLVVLPQRAILLGGPLPLRGSPLVQSAWLRDILLTLAAVTLATPAEVDRALDSGMVASLAPDSAELQQLRDGVAVLAAPPAVRSRRRHTTILGRMVLRLGAARRISVGRRRRADRGGEHRSPL